MVDSLLAFFGLLGFDNPDTVTLIEFFPWLFRLLCCIALVVLAFKAVAYIGRGITGAHRYL